MVAPEWIGLGGEEAVQQGAPPAPKVSEKEVGFVEPTSETQKLVISKQVRLSNRKRRTMQKL